MTKNGFTLVELIATIAILALIFVLAIPTMNNTLIRSKAKQKKQVEDTIKIAADTYVSLNRDCFKSASIYYVSIETLTKEKLLTYPLENPEKNEDKVIPLTSLVKIEKVNLEWQYSYSLDNYGANTGTETICP